MLGDGYSGSPIIKVILMSRWSEPYSIPSDTRGIVSISSILENNRSIVVFSRWVPRWQFLVARPFGVYRTAPISETISSKSSAI